MCRKIRCDGESEIFCKICKELNKALYTHKTDKWKLYVSSFDAVIYSFLYNQSKYFYVSIKPQR